MFVQYYKGQDNLNKKLFFLLSALLLAFWFFQLNGKQMPTYATIRRADGTGYVYSANTHTHIYS